MSVPKKQCLEKFILTNMVDRILYMKVLKENCGG